MKATTNPISLARLGDVYGVTRERARQLVVQFGFEIATDPGRLYDQLLDHGNASKLRTLLSDPIRRADISNQLTLP